MNDPETVLLAGVALACVSLSASILLILLGTYRNFMSRLKDGYTRREAWRGYFQLLRYDWKWRYATPKAMLGVTALGFLIGVVLGTFGIGVAEVVGLR